MTDIEKFNIILERLNPSQRGLLLNMAKSMSKPITETISDNTNLVTENFAADFSNRLIIHHATHQEKFKKKSFEFAFHAAAIAAGWGAEIVSDPTNPGADVIVDGVKFSLKTEAAKSIKESTITISKLMEARWIRDCNTTEDFAQKTTTRVVHHLEQYERILILRAFDVDTDAVRYDLVEIPIPLLLRIKDLKAVDFRPKTQGGGSGANVYLNNQEVLNLNNQEVLNLNNQVIFNLTLDGSVEKITLSNLRVDLCFTHGSWTVPTLKETH